jgi:hypothetical protein
VYVDAINGRVLDTQEHVMRGTGTAAINGPNPVSLNTTQSGGHVPAPGSRRRQHALPGLGEQRHVQRPG